LTSPQSYANMPSLYSGKIYNCVVALEFSSRRTMAGSIVHFRYLILGLVNQQPMTGYDIKKSLERLSWLISSPSFGSLYPALHALEEERWVSVEVVPQEGKPPRKVYSVTERGKQELEKWVNQPVGPGASLRSFVMRLILAGSFAPARLRAHLQQRRSQVAVHHTALEQTALSEKEDLGQRLANSYSLAIAATELAWLDQALNQLSEEDLPMEVV